MKKIIFTILWVLLWFMSFSPAWAEPYDAALGSQSGRECLSERELDDGALSEITGQGLKGSIQEGQESRCPKIILWDEAQCRIAEINFSTGYGNSQRNILSIQGR